MPPNFYSLATLYFMSLFLLQVYTEQQTSPSSHLAPFRVLLSAYNVGNTPGVPSINPHLDSGKEPECPNKRTVPQLASPRPSPAVILNAFRLPQPAFHARKRTVRPRWLRTCCSPVRFIRVPCAAHVVYRSARWLLRPLFPVRQWLLSLWQVRTNTDPCL